MTCIIHTTIGDERKEEKRRKKKRKIERIRKEEVMSMRIIVPDI